MKDGHRILYSDHIVALLKFLLRLHVKNSGSMPVAPTTNIDCCSLVGEWYTRLGRDFSADVFLCSIEEVLLKFRAPQGYGC